MRPFFTRKFFQEILGLEGSKKFLEKNRQVHNLKIFDRLFTIQEFFLRKYSGSAYLQSMDFQRESQSKHHLYFLDCFFVTS